MANMVANIDALNEKQKYTLKQIAHHPKGVSEVILGIDSDTFLTLAPTPC
jgi:predicted transcriptional regulator